MVLGHHLVVAAGGRLLQLERDLEDGAVEGRIDLGGGGAGPRRPRRTSVRDAAALRRRSTASPRLLARSRPMS